MDLLERLRAWTYRRQLLAAPAASLGEALAVVAVYATHPTAPLALRVRTRRFDPAAYRRLDREGAALRIPEMRGTIFLAPRETAPTIFTAVKPGAARIVRTLSRASFTTAEYRRIGARILAAAREPTSSRDLEDAAGIGGQPLGSLLRCLRYEGRLLAVAGESLSSSPHRYVAAEEIAPEGLDHGDPAAALAALAGAYQRAYGPASIEGLAWWAGVPKRDASAALEAHDTIDVGEGLLLPAGDEAAFGRVRRATGVRLLPNRDAYTMGHAPGRRGRFVDPDIEERVYAPLGVGFPGDGNPVILVDGRVAGLWGFTKKDGPSVLPFDSLGPAVRAAVDEELGAIGALLS